MLIKLREFIDDLPHENWETTQEPRRLQPDALSSFLDYKIDEFAQHQSGVDHRVREKLRKALLESIERGDVGDILKKNGDFDLYDILAHYLKFLFPYCQPSFFREYLFLVVMLIRVLQEEGRKFLYKKNMEKGEDFCASQNVKVVSEILNMFIAEKYPVYLKE